MSQPVGALFPGPVIRDKYCVRPYCFCHQGAQRDFRAARYDRDGVSIGNSILLRKARMNFKQRLGENIH